MQKTFETCPQWVLDWSPPIFGRYNNSNQGGWADYIMPITKACPYQVLKATGAPVLEKAALHDQQWF